MKVKKVMGGKFVTDEENQDLITSIEDGIAGNIIFLTDVSICNLSVDEINVIINEGSKIPISSGETLSLGNIVVRSLVVVEKGSTVKFLGLC
jgi:hypothetical protein